MDDEEPMTDERRALLTRALTTWTRHLHLDDVLPYLQQARVLNDGHAETILSKSTPALCRYEFVRQLQRHGNTAFVHFYRALLASNQQSLARLLEKGLDDEEKSTFESNSFIFESVSNSETLREVNENARNEVLQEQRARKEYPRHTLRSDERRGISRRGNQEVIYALENLSLSKNCTEPAEPSGILEDLVVDVVDGLAEGGGDVVYYDVQKIYRNFSAPRGLALIINNRIFKDMPERIGTDIDEYNLRNLLTQLGYVVTVSKNLTAREMLQTSQAFARRPEHTKRDSCIVCVLTHGENNKLFGADDIDIPVHEFISHFNAVNCPALAHKPKIFILQACRGQRYDQGIGFGTDQVDAFGSSFFSCVSPKIENVGSDASVKSPVEADFLIAYATVPGYVSWRNSARGSWFIQSICETFAKFAKKADILEMLTMVHKRVAEVYESSNGSFKQIPECSSRLRRKFYFFPGLTSPPGELL